jgi:hypothetical protein
MRADKFPVMTALKGFKMASGYSEDAATAWAKGKLLEGHAIVSKLAAQTTREHMVILREAFDALRALAAGELTNTPDPLVER